MLTSNVSSRCFETGNGYWCGATFGEAKVSNHFVITFAKHFANKYVSLNVLRKLSEVKML